MRIERYLALLAAAAITAFSANAQTASFLNVPQDAKELAMGGVNAAEDAGFVLEDATMDASVSYFRWNPKGAGSNLINVDLGYKLGNLAILAEAKVNGYGSYPVYDGTGASSGEYTPNEFMAGIGAAYSITPELAVSLMAKYVGSNIAQEAKGTAFCADLNVAYKLNDLTLGLLAANIGSKMNYKTVSAPLPMLIKLGARNDFRFGENFILDAGVDAGYMTQGSYGSVLASAGADLKMFDMVSVRAGYHFSSNAALAPSYVSAGLGFDFSIVSISAAYLFGSPTLSGTLSATLGIKF